MRPIPERNDAQYQGATELEYIIPVALMKSSLKGRKLRQHGRETARGWLVRGP